MDTKENKQLIMRAYEMYKNRDIKGILALQDEEVEWISPESDYIPFAGSYHGRDEVAQFFSKLGQAQDAVTFEPRIFIAEGDKVVVTGISSWRVKATGQTYDNPWCHIFTIRGGKVIRLQQFNDSAAAEAAYRSSQTTGISKDSSLLH